jgi:cytochrome c-type biogenesis protein CcmH
VRTPAAAAHSRARVHARANGTRRRTTTTTAAGPSHVRGHAHTGGARRRTKTIAAALALATALASLSPALTAAASAVAPRTTLPAVEAQVMCVTCKIPLAVAQSPQADRERAYIQTLIDEGRTLAQVKRALVYQYGSEVLGLPPARGFDLGAYLVPGAVVLGLVVLAGVLLPRWRRRARAATAAAAARGSPGGATVAALDPADAARLEADMARFD